MKIFSILALIVLTSCSCVNFARDDAMIKHDELPEKSLEKAPEKVEKAQ